jgi:hypothetical protein
MSRILDLVEERRRQDVDQLLKRIAELEAGGAKVDGAAQVQVDGVDIDPETDVVVEPAQPESDGEKSKPIIAPVVQIAATLPRFADVVKTFQSSADLSRKDDVE